MDGKSWFEPIFQRVSLQVAYFLQFKKQICNDVPKVGLLLGQIEVVLMSYLTLFNCNVDGSLHPFRWSLEAAKNDNKGKETKSATAKHVTC